MGKINKEIVVSADVSEVTYPAFLMFRWEGKGEMISATTVRVGGTAA